MNHLLSRELTIHRAGAGWPRSAAALCRAGFVLAFVLSSGCALWPWSHHPAPAPVVIEVPPAETGPVEPRPVGPPPPDPTVIDRPKSPRPKRPRTAVPPGQADGSAAGDSVAVNGLAGPPTEADSLAQVTVDLTETERERLIGAMRKDLGEAVKAMNSLDQSKLTAEQAATLETVKGLVQSASAARERGDLRTAAALAHKARLLAAVLREH